MQGYLINHQAKRGAKEKNWFQVSYKCKYKRKVLNWWDQMKNKTCYYTVEQQTIISVVIDSSFYWFIEWVSEWVLLWGGWGVGVYTLALVWRSEDKLWSELLFSFRCMASIIELRPLHWVANPSSYRTILQVLR